MLRLLERVPLYPDPPVAEASANSTRSSNGSQTWRADAGTDRADRKRSAERRFVSCFPMGGPPRYKVAPACPSIFPVDSYFHYISRLQYVFAGWGVFAYASDE